MERLSDAVIYVDSKMVMRACVDNCPVLLPSTFRAFEKGENFIVEQIERLPSKAVWITNGDIRKFEVKDDLTHLNPDGTITKTSPGTKFPTRSRRKPKAGEITKAKVSGVDYAKSLLESKLLAEGDVLYGTPDATELESMLADIKKSNEKPKKAVLKAPVEESVESLEDLFGQLKRQLEGG